MAREFMLASVVGRALLAAAITATSVVAEAADIFLRLDGIPGESTDKVHQGEIDLMSYSHSFRNAAGGAGGPGGAGGEPICGLMHATKVIDRSTPLLASHSLRGTVIKSGDITFIRRGSGSVAFEHYKIKLSAVMVISVMQSAGDGPQPIIDSVALRAEKVQVEYTPMTPKGTPGQKVTFGWDCARNAPL